MGSCETKSAYLALFAAGSRVVEACINSSCKAYVISGFGSDRKYVLRTEVMLQMSLNLSWSRRSKEA